MSTTLDATDATEWVTVPRRPTPEMIMAGVQMHGDIAFSGMPAWNAMIAAAPQPASAEEKRAPVQGYSAGIPWSMHLRAYDAYRNRYGRQQAMIEGGCRGGFHTDELDVFIPGWREELSEMAALKAALAFYANRDNYRNRPIDEQRARNSGADPVVYKSRVGDAPAGCALSDIQMDNFGDRARAVLGNGGGSHDQ